MTLVDWREEVAQHEAAHAAALRFYGWQPKVEVGLVPDWDGGHLGRVTVVGPDGDDWSPLASCVVAYAPAVVMFGGSSWEDDAFGRDRANVEDSTPALWKPYPAAWLSKVHDEAVEIVRADEYRLLWWEELQKLKGAA